MPYRLLEQTRLSILSWKPGPRRGREGAIGEHIAGKWHVIALQEAIEYLTGRFCVSLFNKDTFHSDLKVKSTYLHDTRNGQHQVVKEGQSKWVQKAVISHTSFRSIPGNGKSYNTVMSLHINNFFVKKRGIGKNLLLTIRTLMQLEQVDMVAGDFNGTAWRRQSGSDTHQYHHGSLRQHVFTHPTWLHTFVGSRRRAS